MPGREQRERYQAATRAEATAVAARVRKIVVLDTLLDSLIDGTPLRLMRASAVAHLGGWLTNVAAKTAARGGLDALIGEKVTEQEARQLHGG